MSLDPLKQQFNQRARLKFRSPLVSASEEWRKVVKSTNCYSYALNIPDHGWGRPGELNKLLDDRECFSTREITEARIRERLQIDGLIEVALADVSPLTHHVIAAAIDKKKDYHFYRWLEDESWAHKLGYDTVSTVDTSNRRIRSAEECARGRYTDFLGYFIVPEDGIVYTRNPELNEKFWKPITSGISEPTEDEIRTAERSRNRGRDFRP